MDVTLEALEVVDAIAREGSFAGAARALHRVPSAVSYTVQRLEDRLGVALFDRHGHRAALRPAGEAVLAEGRLLLAQARRLEAIARQHGSGWEASLVVVVDGALPMEPVLRALSALADAGAPTRVRLHVEYLSGVQQRFEREAADLMLVKDYEPAALLVALPLPPVEMVLVAGAAHPLASEPGPLPLEQLQAHVELAVQDTGRAAHEAPTHAFLGPRVFYLSDFTTKLQALRLGLGFGWMPRYLVEAELSSGDLRLVAWERGAERSIQPQLVHPLDRPLGRAGELLRDGIAQGFDPTGAHT